MISRLPTGALLAAGVAGPVLFVAVFIVEGATRAGYDPTRQFVSLLSLGDGGWVQVVDFIVGGGFVAAFGVGLRRRWQAGPGSRWAPRLVIAVGLALIWSGVFVTDPALGYPAGAPAGLPGSASWHAGLHYLGAMFVFVGLPAATFVGARREARAGRAGLAAHAVLSGAVMLGCWLAGFIVVGPDGVSSIAGLLQRVSIVAGWQWLAVTAILELGRSGRAMTVQPA